MSKYEDDNDPIKEIKNLRDIGNELSSFDEDYREIESDEHICSDDLSDKGSRAEEIAHARYAQAKRDSINYNKKTTTVNTNKNVKTIIMLYLIVVILGMFLPLIMELLDFMKSSDWNSSYENNNYSYNDYYDDYDDYDDYDYKDYSYNNYITDYYENENFYENRSNVDISGIKQNDSFINVNMSNQAKENIPDFYLYIIFYDANKQIIDIKSNFVDGLSEYETKAILVDDCNLEYANYEFTMIPVFK